MTLLRLALAAQKWKRTTRVALLLAVATTTTILTGALLVGDSVNGSLRDLILSRLGRIDRLILTEVLFREELCNQLQQSADFRQRGMQAESAILARGSLKNPARSMIVSGVTVFGCDDSFWQLGEAGPTKPPQGDQIVLTDRLASRTYLDARIGDRIIVQLGRPQQIPAESPLGRKMETVRRRVWTVSDIVSTDGFGGFSLSPNQTRPLNAFVARAELADMLDQSGKANLILVGRQRGAAPPCLEENAMEITPELTDYGLRLQFVPTSAAAGSGYIDLTSEQMMLPEAVQAAAEKVWTGADQPQATFTYLANWISAGSKRIPYSTVTAIDSIKSLGPLLRADGDPVQLADDEIVLNSWAAEKLQAQPGDRIEITYFDPVTTHGRVEEKTAEFRLHSIVPLFDGQQRATLANDRQLTPELSGVTDQASIDAWDPPFPFDASRVREQDELYWDDYRATPKAFISQRAGETLWSSRFGNLTSLRVPKSKTESAEAAQLRLHRSLQAELSRSGTFAFRDIRGELLRAAGGTTPFGVLFLCFSMFLIFSSLLLLSLLVRLDVDQRAAEWSLLAAVGFQPKRIFQLVCLETFFLVGAGGVVGTLLGILYAATMAHGLRTWWVQAVATPFVHLHVSGLGLASGFVAGGLVCFLAILWSFSSQRRAIQRRGLVAQAHTLASRNVSKRLFRWATFSLLVAVFAVTVAIFGPPSLRTVLFFAAGSSTLLFAITGFGGQLHRLGAERGHHRMQSLFRFAGVCLSRQPQQSVLTIALVAVATFMILSVSAFRIEQNKEGRFNLLAESALPLYFDLASSDGREEYGLNREPDGLLGKTQVVSLRVRGGDDASCLNLYRARHPRIIGVPPTMPHDFFADDLGVDQWGVLLQDLPADAEGNRIVPVVLDQNTARYGLGLYGGVGEQFELTDQSRKTTFQVVALLRNSFFQGSLLVSEDSLLDLYPETEGYRYFLIDTAPDNALAVTTLLEEELADYGFDVEPIADRLAMLFGVQNTYLTAFQALGGLGLLLGTLGLLAVQFRNIFSRRHEFALQQALGFSPHRLSILLIIETIFLLVTGLVAGILAASIAILPYLVDGEVRVPLFATSGLILLFIVGLSVGLISIRRMLKAVPVVALRGE